MQPRTLECVVKKTENIRTEGDTHIHVGPLFTILCHGQLVAGTAHTLKETVNPLIAEGGRIIIDLAEVSYVDSMGLGTMIGIKNSSVAPHSTIEFRNLSERVQELLRFTHLEDVLKA